MWQLIQTVKVLTAFGYNAKAIQHDKEVSLKLFFEGNYIVRIIEGCNAISLIILFVAFIFSFSGTVKATLLFSIIGSALIYIINIRLW